MTPKKLLHNQNGVALIVALTVITVLVALSLTLNQKMNAAFDTSINVYRQTTLSQMTSSGIHAAMAMLAKDRVDSTVDSMQEDWADPEMIEELLAPVTFDDGSVSVVISDERSRIQVNALVKLPEHDFNTSQEHLWTRLLEFLANHYEPLEDIEPNELIDPLKDWIDSGDDDSITGLNGAESDYYTDLEPPYECRNAPLDNLGDLSRIKGFPPDLFYYEGSEEMPSISDLLTVQGAVPVGDNVYTFDGRININTADALVLAAVLPDGYESYAQDMVEYREESDSEGYINELSSLDWYKDISGLEDITIDADIITNASDLFRITAEASLDDAVLTTVAVVRREAIEKTGKWRCKVLYWETK
jgi:general secretion pathway protein K